MRLARIIPRIFPCRRTTSSKPAAPSAERIPSARFPGDSPRGPTSTNRHRRRPSREDRRRMNWAPLPERPRANSGRAQPRRLTACLREGPTGTSWGGATQRLRPARGPTRVTRRRRACGKEEGPHGTRGMIPVAGMEYSEPFAAPRAGWPWIRCSSLAFPRYP